MQVFTLTKKNGKTRTIYAPNAEETEALRALLPDIAAAAQAADTRRVQHGFTAGRSPVTNARQHVGRVYSLCMDLADFFDTVTPEMFGAEVSEEAKSLCFVRGAARQGLPTSPALANLAASHMDNEIMALNRNGRFGVLFVYTRYADDLTFSFDMPHVGEMLRREVPAIIERHGFKINPAKTKLQYAHAGRRHITGIAVGEHGIHPTREAKRRLRAAQHQLRHGLRPRNRAHLIARQVELKRKAHPVTLGGLLVAQGRGLAEWVQLRPPKQSAALHPHAPSPSHAPLQQEARPRFVFMPYGRKLILNPQTNQSNQSTTNNTP